MRILPLKPGPSQIVSEGGLLLDFLGILKIKDGTVCMQSKTNYTIFNTSTIMPSLLF